jgi:hypothetical protein
MNASSPMRQPNLRTNCRAFTRTELLSVLAALVLVGLLAQPALSESRSAARAAVCLSNQQRLQRAWAAHAVDNQEWLVAAETLTQLVLQRTVWMSGILDFETLDGVRLRHITNGPLFAYGDSDLRIYRCPADRSTQERLPGRRPTPRPRSISMSQAFGSGGWLSLEFNPAQTRWRTYSRSSDIVNPGATWLFADEHPDSINDGGMANACTGAESLAERGRIIDMPSSLHEGAGIFAFADGSADLHRWKGKTIRPPVTYSSALALNIPARDSQVDIVWLAARTTVRR